MLTNRHGYGEFAPTILVPGELVTLLVTGATIDDEDRSFVAFGIVAWAEYSTRLTAPPCELIDFEAGSAGIVVRLDDLLADVDDETHVTRLSTIDGMVLWIRLLAEPC